MVPRRANGKARTTRLSGKAKQKKLAALIRRDGNACHWCGMAFSETVPPTFDHRVGLGLGGTDANSNLWLACAPCNNGRANPKLGRRRLAEDGVVSDS